jgi:ADP-L-glycero-D-manno-heptose 6-epimerase
VKDAVDMVLSFMDSNLAGIYNIGSGRAETWNSLAEAVFEAMGVEKNIQYIEMPEHLKDRYQYYTKAEMDKLAKTGYSGNARPLKDSVKDYVQNYLIPDKYLGD